MTQGRGAESTRESGADSSPAGVLQLTAEGAAAHAPPVTPDQLTVLELMRLEAEHALHDAREQRAARSAGQTMRSYRQPMLDGETGAKTSNLHLVGIYGVGQRLVAEVKKGAQTLYFRSGQAQPKGHVNDHTDDPALYRLRELKGNCLRLDFGDEEKSLCLPTRGRP